MKNVAKCVENVAKFDVHSCPKVYLQLTFRFTFSAAISKSLELKMSLIAL